MNTLPIGEQEQLGPLNNTLLLPNSKVTVHSCSDVNRKWGQENNGSRNIMKTKNNRRKRELEENETEAWRTRMKKDV